MKSIVIEIIEKANEERDFDLAKIAKNLIDELSSTYNAPSNWRSIGNEIAEEYKGNSWVCEALELWEYNE